MEIIRSEISVIIYQFAIAFASDVGLCLLIDILHIIRPSCVVQLRMDANRETKHLPNITPEFVANSPGLIYNQVLYYCIPVPVHTQLF